MSRLLLLGTTGCHLCEQAETIVNEALTDSSDFILEYIDIAEFDNWQHQYALRIPVIFHPETQNDLGWPFDLKHVTQFISGLKHD
jgi:Glutaredoxin-like domain (DUF836)